MNKPSREEVIEEIRSVSQSIGSRVLIQKQFLSNSKITISDVLRYFAKWSDACKAAGVDYDTSRDKISEKDLLIDWGRVVRSLGHIPSLNEYLLKGSHGRNAFNRFGLWVDVPKAFSDSFKDSGEWEDVLAILQTASPKTKRTKVIRNPVIKPKSVIPPWHVTPDGSTTYGDPIDFRGLRHAPVNEQGVVFLFGMVAGELDFLVEAIQGGFPDCKAKVKISRGQWKDVSIEFEYLSKHFDDHGHDVQKCDIIVCWIDNWEGRPDKLTVIELSKVINSLSKNK